MPAGANSASARTARLKYTVQKIVSKKKIKGRIHYQVKWKGYKDTSWEPRSELIKDVKDLIEEYEKKIL